VPFAIVLVLPAQRRRGAGSALYAWASGWARERGQSELEAWVKEADEESRAFAERRGFREVAREERLVLDLRESEPLAVGPPQGIEIVTWAERPELARGLYEVNLEASPDIPGDEENEVAPFEEWLARDMGGPGDRPEATFVALAGDDVVGYSKFSLTSAQPTTAYHDLTGVKRAWRGRGIAAALKSAQIAWARANGYERLFTNNEERNLPIKRLNERFGYRREPGRILVRGPVAPA